MFSVLREECHVGYSREFVGTVYCTYGQSNTTIVLKQVLTQLIPGAAFVWQYIWIPYLYTFAHQDKFYNVYIRINPACCECTNVVWLIYIIWIFSESLKFVGEWIMMPVYFCVCWFRPLHIAPQSRLQHTINCHRCDESPLPMRFISLVKRGFTNFVSGTSIRGQMNYISDGLSQVIEAVCLHVWQYMYVRFRSMITLYILDSGLIIN